MPTVEVPANEDTPAGTAAPTPLFVQLQHHPIEHERPTGTKALLGSAGARPKRAL